MSKFRVVDDNGKIEVYHRQGPYAKIIADSISEAGKRITTMEVKFHRFILAEMNTHRAFSRNSASSRAIPASRVRQKVEEGIAYPIEWGSNKSGMQAGTKELDKESIETTWYNACEDQLDHHEILETLRLHKQITNRLLEPFTWHTAIITSTEWNNFFHQRCSPMAQPEMKAIADCMQICYFKSRPEELYKGDIHLPYITKEDKDDLEYDEFMNLVSAARCARVSYLNQNGNRDLENDLLLYRRLLEGGHWSPFEHVAYPLDDAKEWSGNFQGWEQFRKQFSNENATEFEPNVPEAKGE